MFAALVALVSFLPCEVALRQSTVKEGMTVNQVEVVLGESESGFNLLGTTLSYHYARSGLTVVYDGQMRVVQVLRPLPKREAPPQ